MLSLRDIAGLLLALAFLGTLAGVARADPFAEALDRFTADSFNDTIEGVNALAASGHAVMRFLVGKSFGDVLAAFAMQYAYLFLFFGAVWVAVDERA